MPRLIAALTLSLTLAAPLVARAEVASAASVVDAASSPTIAAASSARADASLAGRRPGVRHYRGLEKLLKRFRLEAGSRTHEGRELADARTRG